MAVIRWLKHRFGGGDPPARTRSAAGGDDYGKVDVSEEVFREAVGLHTRGDIDGAESIYRTLLERDPDFVPGLHLLGRIQAQRGRLGEADALFLRAHEHRPQDADILADLVALRRQQGRRGDALALLKSALNAEPGRADIHHALARHHLESGDMESAVGCLERAVAIEPSRADALNDLGAAYLECGRYDDARRTLQSAAELEPSSPGAHQNLATLFLRIGQPAQAVQPLKRALESAPQNRELRRELADALLQSGDPVAALEEFSALTEYEPGDASAWKRLAETASGLGRRTDAVQWYRRALDADPRQPEVLSNLGILLSGDGRYEEATECFQQAVAVQPDFDHGFNNLAGTYHLQGRYDEAATAYSKALEIDPWSRASLSSYIAISHYRYQADECHLTGLQHRFRRSLAPERVRAGAAHRLPRPPEGRLRVGYVSPDFRRHSVAFFIEPLIEGHDRNRFEVHCYADVAAPDAVTERLRSLSDHWLDVSGDSDEALAQRIRRDQIDLLVDLDGHFAGNRLAVFAQKPAPIQISYLGYPGSTGLPEVDYRLTDAIADPPEESDARYAETLLRLPGVFLCYRPPANAPAPAVASDISESITFCCFNELPKVSPETLRCWARILQAEPESRLLLKSTALADPATRDRVSRRFQAAGVSSERIELRGRTATLEEHLALYTRADVALDTFPYNGTTTTCEAIYMGVPVVTLTGDAHAGRVGASLLGALNLPELVARSEDDYVAKAVALATDIERRGSMRSSLRERMLASPLCDARAFVQAVEAAYLQCRDSGLETEGRARQDGPLQVEGAIEIRLGDGARMALPDDIDRLTPYVLLEQEDWFEEETEFLRVFLTEDMRVLDVGANFGVYTLLAARSVGARGRVFSIEPSPTTARWLRANVALNGQDNVEVMEVGLSDRSGELRLSLERDEECNRLLGDDAQLQRGALVQVMRLDELSHRLEMTSVDFVKLDAEGAEKQIIDGGRDFFRQQSPLVMFEVKSGTDPDISLVRKFAGLEYRPMRLLPGLNLLVPVEPESPLDAYALNLFACKSDRFAALAERGLVAPEDFESATARLAPDGAVWAYFDSRAYSRSRVARWKSRYGRPGTESDQRWMRMLGHFIASADSAAPASSRVASLKAAFKTAADDQPGIDSFARLHTLARIARALGHRTLAVEALTRLAALDGDFSAAFDRPFLPASPHFDHLDPGDEVAAWCDACARDQFECLRSFSSCFLGGQNLDDLERLRGNPFQRAEMERRRLLVRLRRGLPSGEVSSLLRTHSPDNNNPDFWLRLEQRD